MATKALTLGAPRPVFDHTSYKKPQKQGSVWRALLLKQDAQAIWDKIASIIRNAPTGEDFPQERLIQDIFIRLLVTDRFGFYVEHGLTDDQIEQDILSLIGR
jgi:hypothetical protein